MNKQILIITFLLMVSSTLFAQGVLDTIHIKEVEINADRFFAKEEAGMKETRIDSLVLMEKINASVSNILAENTTVYIKDYGRGALATASFRGTAPTHTQVSWNGININSPMLGMVDFSLIPVYIIDDMSLQHGAASVSNASGGLGGHISLNNQVNWNNTLSGRFIQGIGSFSTFDEFAQINFGNKKIQSKTRLYHNYSKNDYPFVNKNQKEIDPETGEQYYLTQRNKDGDFFKYGGQQELYIKLRSNLYSSAQVWYQNAERAIPQVLSYEGNDSVAGKTNRQYDETLKGVVHLKHYAGKLKTKLISGVDYQKMHYVTKVKVGGGNEDKPVNSGSIMTSWYNNLKLDYTFSDNIKSEFKADANGFNISTFDTTLQSGYDQKRMEYSLFAATYFAISKQANLSLEVRKDFIPNTKAPVIFNLGTSYKPFTNRNWIIKAAISRNFHNPSLNDLYWQPGGNPNLRPEKGYTAEGGIHRNIAINQWEIENEATAYYSDINDWILWLPSIKGYWEASNIKKVKSYGLEYNIKTSYQMPNAKLSANGNYAYTKSLNQGDPLNPNDNSFGEQLPFIPVHSANALIAYTYKKAYVNYQYQFYGTRNLLNSNLETPGNDFPFYRMYPQHINNVSLGYKVEWNDIKIGTEFKINNIFNEVYRNILNRFMPQRNYSLLIMINF